MRRESGTDHAATAPSFPPGGRVAVRSRFDGHWCPGFEVNDIIEEAAPGVTGYHLRRPSDGVVLPAVFPQEDLIPDWR